MSNSIRKTLLRGLGFAAASGAAFTAPVMAGSLPEVATQQQAAPTEIAASATDTALQAPQATEVAQKAPEVAQTYVAPVAAEVVEVESVNGWYLTVGAGAAWPQSSGVDCSLSSDCFGEEERTSSSRDCSPWGGPCDHGGSSSSSSNNNGRSVSGDLEYGGGFSIDGGIGYDFGAIRTELTYGYTAASLNNVSIGRSNNNGASGSINKNDVFLSAYWDMLPGRWTPYIGGGLGYTNLSTPSFTVNGNRFDGSNQGVFGWQAKVGVSYAMAYNWDIYVEGTYSGASGFDRDCVDFDSYNDWGAKLGFRYRFAKPVVVVVEQPAPAPAPEPMPEPAPAPAPEPVRGLW